MRNETLLYEPRYTLADAARWLDMSSRNVSRWLKGYAYKNRSGESVRVQPVVHREGYEEPTASFLDLIELKFIQAFLDAGLTLKKVRRALEEAKILYNQEYPFSRQIFFTDGHDIYMEIKDQGDVSHLLELLSGGQWVMAPVILQTAQQIDFDSDTGLATRWYPLGRESAVLIDPERRFGEPSLAKGGVQTANVYDLFLAEGKNQQAVADWFNISVEDVEAAVAFEQRAA